MKLATGTERIAALTILAMCVALVIAGYQLLYWDGYAPASGFAPVWVGLAGIALAALMLLQVGRQGFGDEANLPSRSELGRVLSTVAGLGLFVAAAPWLGMICAAFLLMLFMLIVVLRRPPIACIATAVATTLIVYGVFVAWLQVPLPRGIFGI